MFHFVKKNGRQGGIGIEMEFFGMLGLLPSRNVWRVRRKLNEKVEQMIEKGEDVFTPCLVKTAEGVAADKKISRQLCKNFRKRSLLTHSQ